MRSIPTVAGGGRDRSHRLTAIPGQVPSPVNLPPGCPFAPRCRFATPECTQAQPELREIEPGHRVACIHAEQTILQ